MDGFSDYVEVLQKWMDLVIMWRFFRSGWI